MAEWQRRVFSLKKMAKVGKKWRRYLLTHNYCSFDKKTNKLRSQNPIQLYYEHKMLYVRVMLNLDTAKIFFKVNQFCYIYYKDQKTLNYGI